jgi:hypothetical protein
MRRVLFWTVLVLLVTITAVTAFPCSGDARWRRRGVSYMSSEFFTARDAERRTFRIRIIRRGAKGDDVQLVTTQGDPVKRIDRGVYEVVPLGVRVLSDDPNAP